MDKIRIRANKEFSKLLDKHGYGSSLSHFESYEHMCAYNEYAWDEAVKELEMWLDMAYPNLTENEKEWVLSRRKRI